MARTLTVEEFEELYAATARDVLSYVRRRRSGDPEDVVAEVYAVAWRRRADLPAPMLRRAWLFGVARTLLKAEGRQHRQDQEMRGELLVRSGGGAAGPQDGRAAVVVTAALARLAPTDRELLQLVAWEGLTPAELAVALGVRPGTLRVRLHRARRALAADPEIRALVEEPAPVALSSPSG